MELTSSWYPYLILSIISLLCLLLHNSKSRKTCNPPLPLPPGPTPLPIIGSLLELGQMPHRSLARLAKLHGPDVMSLKLGQVTTVVVSSPKAAQEVLQKNDHSLSARYVADAVRFASHHRLSVIWTDSSDPQWKNVRSIMRSQFMTSRVLDAQERLRQLKVKQMITQISQQRSRSSTVDIGSAAFSATLNLLCCTIFSADFTDIDCDVGIGFKDLVWSIMEGIGKPNLSDFFPLLAPLDLHGYRRRLGRAYKIMFQMFDKIIDRRRKEGSSAGDILDQLLMLETEGKLDRDTTKSMLADFFNAGTDTTSLTVEWAMAELLHNPHAMSRARAELADIIGHGNEFLESNIPKLQFLQAVVKETLRLHPAGPLFVPHRASVGVEVCGYFVPEGRRVVVNGWAIGRDESVWMDAERFKPERFLDSDVDFHGRHFELIPFGSGRRICPGLPLALRMVHLILGSLLNSFDWKLPDGMRPEDVDLTEKFGLTLALASALPAIPVPLKD